MTFVIVLFLLVISISFICSMLEAVMLSISPAYVAVAVERKERSGLLLEHLIEKIERPISAILTMNTIVHTLGSAAIAYKVHDLYGDASVTFFSVILTILILIFAEIIPKSIGTAHWKALAPLAAYIVQGLVILLYPFVFLSERINKWLRPEVEVPDVTREEMIMTAEIGAEEGTLKTKESHIIKNLLMLDKIYVSDIMTPRSVFFALEAEMTAEDVVEKYKPLRFSRVPVYKGNLDNIVGMAHRYKILEAVSQDDLTKTVGDLCTPIPTIPERMTVSQALDFFIKEKEHLALAVDEYGVVTGLATLEDAVETLLGVEIVDEFDHIEDMRKYALEQWQLRKQRLRRS
ncbi:MAG: HlyC/CorC family transporter [Bdellovibrionaceae bacterium]|nr:HlyC/CorC family transporter [Pseudobdellovibrionaceae bacterium]